MLIPYSELSPTEWVKILSSDYNVQTGGALVGFRGTPFQRGHGLGSIFRSLFRMIMPAARSAGKAVAKQALISGADVAGDLIQGESLKQSVKRRGAAAAENLLNRAKDKITTRKGYTKLQKGSGIGFKTKRKVIKRKKQVGFGKRKRKARTKKKKQIKDFLGN